MRVKICGITNIEDAQICTEYGADALGFIFHPDSKRFITPPAAKEIISKLPLFLTKVGVFVNVKQDYVNNIANEIGLTAVQLHGDESIEYTSRIELPVIKSFRVDDSFDYSQLMQFSEHSILLDAYSKANYGGTGKKFDWNAIPSELRNRIILAGGIAKENIEEIYNEIRPQAVDLSSSLESAPGKKEHQKVKSFFNLINHIRHSRNH